MDHQRSTHERASFLFLKRSARVFTIKYISAFRKFLHMTYSEWYSEYVEGKEVDSESLKAYNEAVDKNPKSSIIETGSQKGIEYIMGSLSIEKRTAAGNRKSPYHKLTEDEIEFVKSEILAINADINDFVFNSDIVRGTCFLTIDGKVHIKGNIFPDEYSLHPRDKMSVRAVLAHEYYGHKPYREQYLKEDSDTSPNALNKIMRRMWCDEFRASYMAAKNTPNLTTTDRNLLVQDALSRASEAGVTIKYNDFIRRTVYD